MNLQRMAVEVQLRALPDGGTGTAPPGVESGITKLLTYTVWGALVAAIFGVIIGGAKLAIAKHHQQEMKGGDIAMSIIGAIVAIAATTIITTVTT